VIAHMGDDIEAAQYDQLAASFVEFFEGGAEKSAAFAQTALEKARKQLTSAGAFSEEQGLKLKKFMERDFAHMATEMRDEAKEKLDPSRLSVGALSSIASLLRGAGSMLSDVANRADRNLKCRSGEITTAGTLICSACGHEIHKRKTGRVPPCPKCHATEFKKTY